MPKAHSITPKTQLLLCQDSWPIDDNWFSPAYWQQQDALAATATGRGTVWFIDSHYGAFVLRRYRRGGLIAKLTQFRFCFIHIKRTRAWQELALLEEMQRLGLPVPAPIAGKIQRFIGTYEAYILIGTIPHAKELFHYLLDKQEVNWHNIGQTIKRFHLAGIFHSDLNCHNIMIDKADKVWLIDFDKCDQREINPIWPQKNLDRLKRSLEKEGKHNTTISFQPNDWQTLLKGYHG